MPRPIYFTLWLLWWATLWFLLATFATRNTDTASQLHQWRLTLAEGLALGAVFAYLQTGIYFGNRRKREQAQSRAQLQARITEELAEQEKERRQ